MKVIIALLPDGSEHEIEVEESAAVSGAIISVFQHGARARVFRFTPTPGKLLRFEEVQHTFIDERLLPKKVS